MDNPTKPCRLCGETKPLTGFYRADGTRDGHRNECIPCARAQRRRTYRSNPGRYIANAKKWQTENRDRYLAQQRKRREENRESLRQKDRERWLRAKYNLTFDEYNALLDHHQGCCAICGKNDGENLHIDHDHKSNEVRGLLCGSCNRGVGLLQENPKHLRSAEIYLTRHKMKAYEACLENLKREVAELGLR